MKPTKRVAFTTLGCKVNRYDTDVLAAQFRQRGYERVAWNELADVYVVNTCTVTAIADQKSRQFLRQACRRNPEALVVAVGCYAQTAGDELCQLPGVDLVVGTKQRHQVVDLVEALRTNPQAPPSRCVDEGEWRFADLGTGLGERVRATLKVEDGCAQFCTYCKIPYARGPVRSRPLADALASAKELLAQGYKEIVLTGIHLGAYGEDLGVTLVELVDQLAQLPGLERLRLSSLEPTDVTPELLATFKAHPNICRHLHIPLQSGSDRILAAMRRPYTTAAYRALVTQIRACLPNLALTTDVIVGFPGEGEPEFAETRAFLQEMRFSRLHVFPYSARKGTPAAQYPNQVPVALRRARTRELIALGHELALAYHEQLVGQTQLVLLEKKTPKGWEGLTEGYVRVRATTEAPLRSGEIVPVKLKAASKEIVTGIVLLKNVNKL